MFRVPGFGGHRVEGLAELRGLLLHQAVLEERLEQPHVPDFTYKRLQFMKHSGNEIYYT